MITKLIILLFTFSVFADERVDKLFSDLQKIDKEIHEASYIFKAREARRLFGDFYLELVLPLDQDFVFEPQILSRDLIKEWGDDFKTLSKPIRLAIEHPDRCIDMLLGNGG